MSLTPLPVLEIRRTGLDAFRARTGVLAKRSREFPNLVSLKYDRGCDMSDPAIQQCRGLVLDEDDDWRVLAWPFNKFWNFGEPLAAQIDWSTAKVFEKLDGSLCTLYYYRKAERWLVATTGNPTGDGETDTPGVSFSDAFWEQCDLHFPWRDRSFPGDGFRCFMFELHTKHNPIVVSRPCGLTLIGVRDLSSGWEDSPRRERERWVEEGFHVDIPHRLLRLHGSNPGIAEKVTRMLTSVKGTEMEGVVIVDDQWNRVKLKAPDYVRLHRLRSGTSPRGLLGAICARDIDEITIAFPHLRPVVGALQAKISTLAAEIQEEFDAIKNIEERDVFAFAAKARRVPAALFALYDQKVETGNDWLLSLGARRLQRLLAEVD